MPRFWLSGPRILGGLLRAGVSVSSKDLSKPKQSPKQAPQFVPETMLGVLRYSDGAITILHAIQKEAHEDVPGSTVPGVFVFPDSAAALATREGALVRLGKHVAADGRITGCSVGQVFAAIRAEATALMFETKFVRLSGFGGSLTYTPAGPFFPFSKQERGNTELLVLHNSN